MNEVNFAQLAVNAGPLNTDVIFMHILRMMLDT